MQDWQQQSRPFASDPGHSRQRLIRVRELLGTEGSVELEHRGEIYRLRITRNGKLILTK